LQKKLIVTISFVFLIFSCQRTTTEAPKKEKSVQRPEEDKSTVKKFAIQNGSSLSQELSAAGIDINAAKLIQKQLSKYVEMRSLPAGFKFETVRVKKQLEKIVFKMSKLEQLTMSSPEFKPYLTKKATKPIVRWFSGRVKSTLWESAKVAGVPPNLILDMTDIFAWQIDFNREIRTGDSWRIRVTEIQADGEHIGWEKIKIAEYKNKNEAFKAIYYKSPYAKFPSYYFPTGESLKRLFLKSPIKFGRVTSKFSKKRFHPIFKTRKPHNGVDYGAPIGTPISTVGDGKISFIGWKGGSGRLVKIKHNSIYTTSYSHLSRFKKGIKVGQNISQGSIIGFVGKSGLATGPHLHFAFYERGRFVDPLGKKFPSADPIHKDHLAEFKVFAKKQLADLKQHTNQTQLQAKSDETDVWKDF